MLLLSGKSLGNALKVKGIIVYSRGASKTLVVDHAFKILANMGNALLKNFITFLDKPRGPYLRIAGELCPDSYSHLGHATGIQPSL